jgi:hypothetical protein
LDEDVCVMVMMMVKKKRWRMRTEVCSFMTTVLTQFSFLVFAALANTTGFGSQYPWQGESFSRQSRSLAGMEGRLQRVGAAI